VELLTRHRSFGDGAAGHLFRMPLKSKCDPVAWVAETQARISGFVFGFECAGKVAHFQAVVHSQFRGRDIDRRLARVALESARERGCLKIVLHNARAAPWAIQILEKSGFIFSRRRESNRETCLEFYVDLYARRSDQSGADHVRATKKNGPLPHQHINLPARPGHASENL
jgi:ribosomal protein S18 acetylase RimI-like enzyme